MSNNVKKSEGSKRSKLCWSTYSWKFIVKFKQYFTVYLCIYITYMYYVILYIITFSSVTCNDKKCNCTKWMFELGVRNSKKMANKVTHQMVWDDGGGMVVSFTHQWKQMEREIYDKDMVRSNVNYSIKVYVANTVVK